MCGIVGSFGDQVDEKWIEDSLEILKHRGPDNSNYKIINAQVIFGATRLSMTDPHPRSNQPFYDLITGSALVFNGEIYNYKELRSELQNRGITFNTESDTEVLLQVLLNFGESGISKLNGMFAFAFYSGLHKNLILSRDLLGKKPLYYKICGENFYFSSSVRSLNFNSKMVFSPLNLAEYFALGYLIDPDTPSKEIQAVLPGEILILDKMMKKSTQKILRGTAKQAKNNIRELLKQALFDRIEGHDRFGISLSGGVDSHILAKLSSEITSGAKAYSVSWRDSDKTKYNVDANNAQKIAKYLGINFIDVGIFPASQLHNYIDKYLSYTEEPNANPTGLSMFYLYEQMKLNGERLAITGDGADEIFGGYPRYDRANLIPKIPWRMYLKLKQLRESIGVRNLNNFNFDYLFSANRHVDDWLHWHQIFTESDLKKYLPNIWENHKVFRNKLQALIQFDAKQLDKLPRHYVLMLFDNRFWLPNESNRRLDRVSMANSIEARSPFQDDNITSFFKSSSMDFKKITNKTYLKEQFPDIEFNSFDSKKRGFISPLGYWLRSNPDLVCESIEYLYDKDFIDKKKIQHLMMSPQNKDFIEMQKLWSLIIFSRWWQINEK